MTVVVPTAHPVPAPQTLRWLIAEGPSISAVQHLLPGVPLHGLEVERVHFSDTKPLQLQVRVWDDIGLSRLLIAEWAGQEAEQQALTETTRLTKSRRHQTSLSIAPAVHADAKRGLVLRRLGFDAKLPGLRLLHDSEWAASRLAALGCDPASEVALVAHRLGKRAVLKITSPSGTRYARLRPVSSAAGQAAFDRHMALWNALQARGAQGATRLLIPRPVQFDADLGLALFDALPGQPPLFKGLAGYRATQAVMHALGALQSLDVTAPRHGQAEEVAILAAWSGRISKFFPSLAHRMAVPLARLREDLATMPALGPVPCHRDLHEGQILLDERQAGFLDFDTLSLGDPAMDAGNLQAHLILAGLRDGAPRKAFVTAIENSVPHLPLARIGLWRRSALLRLAMIYAYSTTPASVVTGLIDEAT